MKTITIHIDNDLERKLEGISHDEGQDIADVAVKILSQGLSERDRRAKALQALDEVFSKHVPPPFRNMSEDEVMSIVDEEIQATRHAQ